MLYYMIAPLSQYIMFIFMRCSTFCLLIFFALYSYVLGIKPCSIFHRFKDSAWFVFAIVNSVWTTFCWVSIFLNSEGVWYIFFTVYNMYKIGNHKGAWRPAHIVTTVFFYSGVLYCCGLNHLSDLWLLCHLAVWHGW